MVDKAFLEELRDRLPISGIVGQYVQLKRAGSNFKGVCPFHQEKTPSFMVSDQKQIFHCFGCGAGGDIFTFVMKHQGLSFPDALESLATQAGMQVPKFEGSREDGKKDEFLAILKESAEFYQRQLEARQGETAQKYLAKRKVADASIKDHLLGYAPAEGNQLTAHLRKKFNLDLAIELGLIRRREDKSFYDFFRHRLMFPIFSARGKVIAFSGRSLEEKQEPKYMNSPESEMFHKATTLYGLDKAQNMIRKNDQVVIVEGQLDVISTRDNGIENVVAPLGTAFTPGHIHVLSRYSKNMVLLFDGDSAGKKAAWRLLPIFLEEEMMPKAASLPEGEDPDSFVKTKGGAELKTLIEKAPLLIEFILNLMLASKKDNESVLSAIKQMIPAIEKNKNPIEQNFFKKLISEKLGIPVGEISSNAPQRIYSARGIPMNLISPERLLVKTLVKNPELYQKFEKDIGSLNISDPWAASLIEIIKDFEPEKINEKTTHLLQKTDDDELKQEITRLSLEEDDAEERPEDVIADCIKYYEKQRLEEEIGAIDNILRQGKTSPSNADLELDLLGKKMELEKRRRGLFVREKEKINEH